jgi:hypothetical protein
MDARNIDEPLSASVQVAGFIILTGDTGALRRRR